MEVRYPDHDSQTQSTGVVFASPVGTAASGRLIFASGVAALHLSGDPGLGDLWRARFERDIPGVGVQEGVVTIQCRHDPPLDWLPRAGEPSAEVVLNGSIPWEIEFRRGVSQLSADLRSVRLRSLDLAGSSRVQIALPHPEGVTYIHFAASASDVSIHRPVDVPVQFSLNGSATRLTLDERRIQAVGDGLRWRSADYLDSTSRYEISVSGSVSNFTIGHTPAANHP